MLNGQKKSSHTHTWSFPFFTVITEPHSKAGVYLILQCFAPANCNRKQSALLLSLKPTQISPSIPRNPIALDKSVSALIAM